MLWKTIKTIFELGYYKYEINTYINEDEKIIRGGAKVLKGMFPISFLVPSNVVLLTIYFFNSSKLTFVNKKMLT